MKELAEVRVGMAHDTGEHTMVMTFKGVSQCLTCGYWTRLEASALSRVPCHEDELPTEQMEVV